MSLENATITWKASQVASMIEKERIVIQSIYQRPYEWKADKQTDLMHTALVGFPIPPVYAKRLHDDSKKNNNVYSILDGQQRLWTLEKIIHDKVTFKELPPVTILNDDTQEEETFDVSGKVFSELPESFQNKIKSASVTVYYFDSLTSEEERVLFCKLNNGKSLTTKSKNIAYCRDLSNILEIGSHRMFDAMLTNTARNKKAQVSIIMKIWCMLHMDVTEVSFDSKVFNPLIENTVVSEADKEEMIRLFDYIASVHDILDKWMVGKMMYKELHLVSMIPFYKKAMENSYDVNDVADWLVEFFGELSSEYKMACSGGTGKTYTINTRHNIIEESFDGFFQKK